MGGVVKSLENAKHLTVKAKAALKLSDEERINYIRASRWIGYSKANEVIGKLEDLLTYPKKHRMPNLLLVGDTNNGKTAIINQFAKRHPRDDNQSGESIIVPVLIVEVRPVPDETSLYNAILKEINAPHRERGDIDQKRHQVIDLSTIIRLQMLILDELHSMLAGNLNKQSGFRNTIKFLGNQLRIPIVGVGTREAFQAIQTDEQLANRFEPILLSRWDMGDEYLRLLSTFEAMLPLWVPSNLKETSLALKILSMSEGLIGEISALLEKASIKAIQTGNESINVKLLDSIKWIQPSKRKEPSVLA
jgi:hypothetical protein